MKVCAALGVDAKPILGDLKALKAIFAARNEMIRAACPCGPGRSNVSLAISATDHASEAPQAP